jgi:hypothetical protein
LTACFGYAPHSTLKQGRPSETPPVAASPDKAAVSKSIPRKEERGPVVVVLAADAAAADAVIRGWQARNRRATRRVARGRYPAERDTGATKQSDPD